MESRFLRIASVFAVVFTLALPVLAQDTTTKGNLGGVVTDKTGAVVVGAKVTMSGPTGDRTVESDKEGRFIFPSLDPGFYGLKVEKEGFSAAELKTIGVVVGKTASVNIALKTGTVNETVEVSSSAIGVDTTSTAISTNLTDEFYAKVPMGRGVANLFYTAPGVANGGGTGTSNPSISGSSGLENTYVADGVNITDSAFGGLGTFTRAQGSIGTGINLSFIKEVQVKTSGFEPQYGQSDGGIIQIVTKSGGNAFHGAIAGYAAPEALKADPLFRDDFRTIPIGKSPGDSNYDASGEFGGYVPHFKEHLFFFGSGNPSWRINPRLTPPTAGLVKTNPVVRQRTTTYNYDAKLTWRINDSHQLEGSIFADPSHTNVGGYNLGSLLASNNTGFSSLQYGTRNIVGRYNGTLSPTWLVNGSFAYNVNDFTESPSSNVYQIVDRTGATNTLQGFGFLENHKAHTYKLSGDTSKIVNLIGQHTFSLGYMWENPNYTDVKARSGGRYLVPALNATGGTWLPTTNSPAGKMSDAQFTLRQAPASCTLCPLYPTGGNGPLIPVALNQSRGEFGAGGKIPTFGKYHAGYVNDSWEMNKHVTVNLGLRWEQQRFAGNVASQQYTFTDNWAPRFGVSVDPTGNRKTKIFYNFGRYNYELPLDAAIRQLSEELDLLGANFAPVINGNQVTAVLDQAHLLNNATGGIAGNGKVSVAGLGEAIASGTKMSYTDESVVGVEHEYKGFILSARYVDRRLQRVIEDVGSVSPEGNLILSQNSFIANPSPSLDLFVNEIQKLIPAGTAVAAFPTGCNASNTTNVSGGVATGNTADANGNVFTPNSICFPSPGPGLTGGDVGADGKPDGFVKPSRVYRAVEFEINKAFSHNYLLRVNYRIAHLYGNYEGAFRNDNGQTDPGISSLFDFTPGNFNLLGDQFKNGDLNTDRRHVVNAFLSYTLDRSMARGLTLGTAVRVQTGTPISQFGDHPAYQNAGEVPIGGRGILGRTLPQGTVDFKAEYPFKIGERSTISIGADLFNIVNARRIFLVDQNRDLSSQAANSNVDFQKPLQFQAPFAARFSARWSF